jgi:DNA-binding transcriptional regulator YiaG
MTGSEIRTLRRSLKMNQQEFADRLGVAKSTVARWEIEHVKPSPLAVARIKELEELTKE